MEGLGISLPTLVAQVINFLILLGLLYLVAYKPILKIFDERSQKIKESMDQADYVKEQAANAEEEVKKRLEAAGKEGQELIARAMRTSEESRQKALQEAKKEADVVMEKARLEIQREKEETVEEVRQEFSDLAIVAAEKVIEKSLNKEEHQKLIDKVLEESTHYNQG